MLSYKILVFRACFASSGLARPSISLLAARSLDYSHALFSLLSVCLLVYGGIDFSLILWASYSVPDPGPDLGG